jgi:cyclopropane fatty-acyl-phospholipid synthase-like methyltransferase
MMDDRFILESMMGPCSLMLIEELSSKLDIKPGMRVLDLGCGKAMTSIFLAEHFDITVYAVDLWIPATENYMSIKRFGLEDRIIPIHSNALSLPFADDYFDIAVSIDAYHYFGTDESYLDDHLSPIIKKGGIIAVACPGFSDEFTDVIPEFLLPLCPKEDLETLHSRLWWERLWKKSKTIELKDSFDLSCSAKAWEKWLEAKELNEYAQGDVDFYEEARNILITSAMIAKKI